MKQAIIYLRKSQDKRGQVYSIGAQRDQIHIFANSNNIDIVGEYVEVASGADKERPQLKEAIAYAEAFHLPIIILRVDRLSRSAAHITSLLENPKLVFIVAELGLSATPFQLALFGLLAQQERELLSKRTKEGLARAKTRGVILGNPNLDSVRKLGHEANRAKGRATALRMGAFLTSLKGMYTYKELCHFLNENSYPSPRGKIGSWDPTQARRIIKRYEQELTNDRQEDQEAKE